MSIGLRLTIRCAILFCLALSLTSFFAYAFHVRAHYDDLDRILLENATHAASEVDTSAISLERLHEANEIGGIDLVSRLYNATGELVQSQPNPDELPPIRPQAILERPSGPAYDMLASLAPPVSAPPVPGKGAFGLLSIAQQRWRLFVVPVHEAGTLSGYVEALTPLGHLDTSIQNLRGLLLALWILGMITTRWGCG